jgi:NAD(P)-dependent dehydrogenase (short-subunit alcohol dehydrogenase family)
MQLLKDKVILITGSTTGIGAAAAKLCVAEGAKVMIHGRNEAQAKKLSQELGNNTSYVIADLADPASYPLLVNKTVAAFGALHGLVNNAGIYPRNTVDEATSELFNEIMTINVKAPLLIAKEAVRVFRQQKTGGSIVNIGSLNAYCGEPILLIYSMSKGALMTMTRNLADALGSEKIRVNQLNIGWTPTESTIEAVKLAQGLPDNWPTRVPSMYAPIGRLQSPEETAPHVAFWLSDYSAPTSGAVYEVEQYPVIGRNRICDVKII